MQLTGTEPSTLSSAVASYVTINPSPDSMELIEDIVITGGFVSTKIISTVNDFVAVFPAESVAVQVTVVVPTGKRNPDGGSQVGVMLPSTSSFDIALNVTEVNSSDDSMVVFEGTEITGGVESTGSVDKTVTVNDSCDVLSEESVAVQVT